MAEKVQLEVEIKGGESVAQASGKVENLRTKLKALKQQLASGQLSGDEFQKIAQQAGELDDKLKDVNQRVKNLGSDTAKLDGFINVAQGIAGGFAAAQGAIALFGSENEDLQKSLMKVQGAVALLSGVQAIANVLQKESAAMTAFMTIKTNLQAAAQKFLTATTLQSVAATYALRAALIASGIGAFIVLLGAAAGAMGAFTNSTDDNKAATDRLKKSHEDLKTALEEEANAIARLDAQNIESSKQRGDALSTQIKIEQEALQNRLDAGRSEIKRILMMRDAYKQDSEDYQKYEAERVAQAQKNLDIVNEIELSKIRYKGALDKEEADRLAKANEKQSAANEKANQLLKQQRDEEERIRKEYNKRRYELAVDTNAAFERLGKSAEEVEIMNLKDAYAEKLKLSEQDFETTKQLLELQKSELSAIDKKYRDAEAEAKKEAKEKEDREAKEQSDLLKQAYYERLTITSDGLNALANITTAFAGKSEEGQKRAFAVNKALNISTAIIDTYMAAQKAYASQLAILTPDAPIRAQVAAGVAVASGLARVAAISSTQFNSTSGNNPSGGGGVPTGNQPNIQGYTTNNQPNQQSGQSGNMRVYVTETDIRNATRKINGIYSQATVE